MSHIPVARVINLDRSTDRLAAITARLAAAGIDWQRHPAAAPASTEAALTHPLYRGARMRKLFRRDMTRGEVGCFLSHMAAMQAALDEGAPLALIFEDDAVPFDGAKSALEALSNWIIYQTGKPVDWLHLSRPTEKWSRPLALVDDISVRRTFRPPFVSSANLWTRKGMQTFLLSVERNGMDRPVDDAMRACFCQSGSAAVLEKPIFGEDGSPTTIDTQVGSSAPATRLRKWRRKLPDYTWAVWNRWHGA